MSKKQIIGSLAIILLLPLMFLGPDQELSVQSYAIQCVLPLMIVLVFWVNYLWLIPMYFGKGNSRKTLVLSNIVIVLVCCFALIMWHRFEVSLIRQSEDIPVMSVEHSYDIRHFISENKIPSEGEQPSDGITFVHRHPRNKVHIPFFIFAAFRDGLNLLLAVFIAYALRMGQHITELQNKQKEAEAARRDAELRGLRNQISPHFLLNTLNNIYALAQISAERTQGAVMKLSKMLRHMLYDNQSEMVTLKSEAEFISSYIDLMRLRLASNVKVETIIDVNENQQTKVAPLLFISLVENAFKHGVSSTAPCLISITLKEATGVDGKNEIICDIKNSNNPKKATDRSGHGVGLQLVQQRLEVMYHGYYTWKKGLQDDGLYHSVIILHK